MCERRTKEVMDGEREICRIFIERQVVCLCPTFLQRSCQVDNWFIWPLTAKCWGKYLFIFNHLRCSGTERSRPWRRIKLGWCHALTPPLNIRRKSSRYIISLSIISSDVIIATRSWFRDSSRTNFESPELGAKVLVLDLMLRTWSSCWSWSWSLVLASEGKVLKTCWGLGLGLSLEWKILVLRKCLDYITDYFIWTFDFL